MNASTRDQIDQALGDLVQGEKTWAETPLARRRELLDEVRSLTTKHGGDWVEAAAGIKGLSAGSALRGEEWITGPYAVAVALAALAESLDALDKGRSPLDRAKFGAAPGDRVTVKALPYNIFDHLLLSGFRADVWLQPGVTATQAADTAGLAQRDPTRTNGVGAVLGAGNIFSIAPLDTIYELYANNRMVALKLNPITDPMLPVWSKVLAPLIELGAVRIVTGGAAEGEYLVQHQLVDHVHMTGSARTHDAIVYGTGADGERRKAADEPILTKPVTSELGGVSPTIVLPGNWSKRDIAFQARHVATQRLHNNGYNCVAAQVVVLSARWPQRDRFIAELRKAIEGAPERPAYYPGSDDRVAAADQANPGAQHLGARVLVVNPKDRTDLVTTEYFGPVLGVIELDSDGTDFAAEAARVVNDDFVGTLGANVLAHPRTIRKLGGAFTDFIASLRYGTIAINAWTGVGYLTPRATWGAFPGHVRNDVQSGIGVVHNAFLLAQPERTVVRGPFRPLPRSVLHGELAISPKPPWFVNNRTAAWTGRLLVNFARRPSWFKLPAIFASALSG